MTRSSETKVTITCDKCGATKTFILDGEADVPDDDYEEWRTIGTNFLGFFDFLENGFQYDLCPDCIKDFREEFIRYFPEAFKKAFDNR